MFSTICKKYVKINTLISLLITYQNLYIPLRLIKLIYSILLLEGWRWFLIGWLQNVIKNTSKKIGVQWCYMLHFSCKFPSFAGSVWMNFIFFVFYKNTAFHLLRHFLQRTYKMYQNKNVSEWHNRNGKYLFKVNNWISK